MKIGHICDAGDEPSWAYRPQRQRDGHNDDGGSTPGSQLLGLEAGGEGVEPSSKRTKFTSPGAERLAELIDKVTWSGPPKGFL